MAALPGQTPPDDAPLTEGSANDTLPAEHDTLGAEQNAPSLLASYRAFLNSPAYTNNIDLAVLTKLAADESVPHRERLRAAEMLLRYRLRAMETLASLEGVREQVLRELGIETGPQVALTQVNQTIEIVRADDWRSAAPLQPGSTVEVLPAPTTEPAPLPSEEHATNGHGRET